MVLEIAKIQDVKLQEIAKKIDRKGNDNNKIDGDEIGKLLTKMTKNKYEFQDFKNLLGNDFENLPNEEKLNIYQNCHEQLKDSMGFAESTVKDGENLDCCFGKDVLKLTGLSTLLGGGLSMNINSPISIRKISKGALIGSMVGFVLSSIACMGDKITYENSKEKCIIKDETLLNLENEMNKLK